MRGGELRGGELRGRIARGARHAAVTLHALDVLEEAEGGDDFSGTAGHVELLKEENAALQTSLKAHEKYMAFANAKNEKLRADNDKLRADVAELQRQILEKAEASEKPVRHPCMPKGSKVAHKGIDIEGSGDWHRCHKLVKKLFDDHGDDCK